MAKLIKFETTKTYATEANAIKAVEKIYAGENNLRYFIMPTVDGRFYPIFVGQEALQRMVHFNFHVVA